VVLAMPERSTRSSDFTAERRSGKSRRRRAAITPETGERDASRGAPMAAFRVITCRHVRSLHLETRAIYYLTSRRANV
jgi:hypothetical protein